MVSLERICPDRSLGRHHGLDHHTGEHGPKAPPVWADHFRGKLAESGLRYVGGRSERTQTDDFRCPQAEAAGVCELIDAAIEYANDCFEQNALAAARRALDARQTARSDLPGGRGDQPET